MGEIIAQVPSQIITTDKYKLEISIFKKIGDKTSNELQEVTHILKNSEAFEYLTKMQNSYDNFEAIIDQSGQRIERFGLDANVVQRILHIDNIHSLGLHLGVNNNQKMTTVFIGKDKHGKLLLGGNTKNINDEGDPFDFSKPCPNDCN
ncbi:hypothetical protein KORDIASMS9_03794 [Kordia sp. SMS9]|uniref:hypothetical protein n=1 Tax=Kordia sp. SMS9 TaxID=2282170 RepID=UPI000E0D6AE4|nr:hypothetical protein [Kordia sp. SMS9]AXG71537.1 hypothetical protein KORDIASMS9_03794 [Kordia sp. SMS9]